MIHSHLPALGLRELIRYYYQVESDVAFTTTLQPVPARSPQILEFMFAKPFGIDRLGGDPVEDARAITLVGAQTFRRVDLLLRGRIDAFTITFQPGGLRTLFSIPAVELTNADFGGEEVLGRTAGELYSRLGEASSFSERVLVANQYFLTRRRKDPESKIPGVASHVIALDGNVSVSELAGSTGLGVRQFERRFCQEIGIAPKLYARIIRFEAALRYKAATPRATWTDIAHTLCYHDQMHMVHDFRKLGGDSPSQIGNQLDMFVLPEVTCSGNPAPMVPSRRVTRSLRWVERKAAK